MPPVHVAAERRIPAPAAAVYALLADYQHGHPLILPPAFIDLNVLEGGTGAGTRIRFGVKLGPTTRQVEAVVTEPEPGRVMAESDAETGAVTTFTVDPVGDESLLRLETTWRQSRGLVGLIERHVAPRFLRKLYAQELDLIERWAEERRSGSR